MARTLLLYMLTADPSFARLQSLGLKTLQLSKTGQRRITSRFVHRITDKLSSRSSGGPIASTAASPQPPGHPCSPFLTECLFTEHTSNNCPMIHFLIELLVRRTWFGQFDELYFVPNGLVMRCKLRPELAADAQQTA